MRHARHVRHAQRTPSRAELLARNMKKRGAPQEQPEPDTSPPAAPVGAPYDPVTVTVRGLADALDDVEDADVVRALQAADPRTSADRYYDARLEELEGAGGG